MFTNLARLTMGTAAMVLAGTTFALAETTATPAPNFVSQGLAAPAPKATPKPRFTWSVKTRAYDFTRQNASAYTQGKANTLINQQSFELGIMPHVEYNIWKGLSIGATYFYGNPLNGCSTISSQLSTGACPIQSKNAYSASQLNPDDTLPGYQLSTLDEAYLMWKDNTTYVKVGNQIINTPWAPSSDSRINPSAFQGADAIVNLGAHWQVQGSYMDRFEARNWNMFGRTTLLTNEFNGGAYSYGSPYLATNIYNPSGSSIQTSGFTMGRVGYAAGALTANIYNYNFLNIANTYWLDAKYSFNNVPLHPFIQIQGGDQTNSGASVVGKIDSQIYGVLGGVNLDRNWLLTAAYNGMPQKTDTVRLPTGYTCTTGVITGTAAAAKQSLGYFLPTGGTSNCTVNANGTTNIYYGGWASPYSYSYATDPLFTTSLTQGLIDRASAGQAYLTRLTYTSDNHKLVAYVSFAGYDYNTPGYAQATTEWNADATYYLNKPAPAGGRYKGLMLRYRFGQRYQTGNTYFGGPPLFTYNRFQAEYDI